LLESARKRGSGDVEGEMSMFLHSKEERERERGPEKEDVNELNLED
jgi:hypothetical protein